jgi:hypothetical protein
MEATASTIRKHGNARSRMAGWRSALKQEIREARWNSLKSMEPACATR